MQAETAATEKLSLAKRALNAITSPVGLLIAGAAAVAALTKAVYDVNQSLQDLKDLGQAFLKDKFWGTGEAFQDLQKATVQLRKDMIGLTQDLQKLNDIAGDKGFDFQDETKNLNFRKQAYEDYVAFRIKASEKEIEIATREKEIADQAVRAEESRRGVGKGNALKEFYDKQSEAVQKLYDANDKYLDLTTQVIPKERRKMINDEIIQEIELLRSKKLGADSAVETLKNQVADETLLLEKRQKAFQKLTEEQLKAQNEEFLLLEKFGLQRAELDDLLATKDAVALQRKITDLGLTRLGIEQQNELAKVIVETQKNELDRAAALDKIDAKRKENLETIATLEKEIARIQTDREIFEAQELVAEKQKKSNELLQDSLSKTFLFSTKVKKAALNALQEEFEATASEFEY
jgi:hypothetical protein